MNRPSKASRCWWTTHNIDSVLCGRKYVGSFSKHLTLVEDLKHWHVKNDFLFISSPENGVSTLFVNESILDINYPELLTPVLPSTEPKD